MLLRTLSVLALAALAVLFTATPVLAAGAPGSAPLVAGYWSEFIDHWSEVFGKQNGIVMVALVVGAVCLFIITRGKWKK